MRRSESSVSYFKDLLDRLEDPTKVKNGLEDGPWGDSQIPTSTRQLIPLLSADYARVEHRCDGWMDGWRVRTYP